MSLGKFEIFFFILIASNAALADIPVEVIGSCQNYKAVKSSVTFTQIGQPLGEEDSNNCKEHIEFTDGDFNYGAITCNNENFLLLKKTRINLNTAQNHSVNPSITPGDSITQTSDWSKITFNEINYLCIGVPLSPTGQGGNVLQYYVVENAFNKDTPILHYYFFNREIMPITSINE